MRTYNLLSGELAEAFDNSVEIFKTVLRVSVFLNRRFGMFRKYVLAFCVVLLSVSFFLPAGANAQESDYVPALGRIYVQQVETAEANACVTIVPLNPVTEQTITIQTPAYWIWAPMIIARGPQCIPIPDDLIGAVGILSANDFVVPISSDDVTSFQAIGEAMFNQLTYNLNPTIDHTVVEEARRSSSNGYYAELLGVWYLGQQDASAAGADVIPPPPFEDPGSFYVVRLKIASDLFTNATFLKLLPNTNLYTCASEACGPVPLAALCPSGADLSDFQVIYLGSYLLPKIIGTVTKMEMWTEIGHTQRTTTLCPGIASWKYIDGPDTWASMQASDRTDVETVVEGQREWLSRNFWLLPVGGGQAVAAPATFEALDSGTIVWIGIAVEVGGIILRFLVGARMVAVP
ncbi:MAG: hypothetical protein NUV98_03460 [Candidatus Roizmanbacteria bacterium]|nr:hypothetical protein [Candidatus Roizmanbacteria bacterium]